MKYIEDLRPDPTSLIESMRDIGYSMETAVADLIDNSITAGASNIDIRFSWNDGNPWLAIIDDGCGMDSEKLTNAMRLGSKNPLEKRDKKDLGRYGLGLKTASFSQCRKLTVISKVGEPIEGREWDLDEIASSENREWKLGILDQDEIDSIKHSRQIRGRGTLVLWQKLDRLDNFDQLSIREKKLGSLVAAARRHIELTFHRFLSPGGGTKKLNISMNGDPLEAFNPFNPLNPATRELSEQKIYLEHETISVQPYVLPHYNKVPRDEYEKYAGESGYLQNQGFYVYRNRRLIIKSTWFRLIPREELTKLLRVRIDLPNTLDHLWRIDVKKANASPPEVIRKQLKQIIYSIQDSGKQVYKQKGKRLRSSVSVPGWSKNAVGGKFTYEINKNHPMVIQVVEQLSPDQEHKLTDLLLMLESSFPAELFYSDLASDPDKLEKPTFDEIKLSDLIDLFVSEFIESGIKKDEVAKQILSIDPFAAQDILTKKILENKGYLCE